MPVIDPLIAPKLPRAPAGLKARGRALWRSIVAGYELSAVELMILESACRQLDAIHELDQVVAAATSIEVEGSKGQLTLHPAIAEARQARLALSRLIAGLDLDDAGAAQTAGAIRSQAGRRLARMRWSNDGRRASSG